MFKTLFDITCAEHTLTQGQKMNQTYVASVYIYWIFYSHYITKNKQVI